MTSLLHAHRMMQLNSVTRSAEQVSRRRRGEPSEEEGRALLRASEVAREAGRGMPSVRGENTVAAAGGANGANGGRGGEAS